jgi:predicted metal-dependent hydrolase
MFRGLLKLTNPAPGIEQLQIGSKSVALVFVRSSKARRYSLRLRADGVARVTVPRKGSISTAREFVEKNLGWLERQIHKLESRPRITAEWRLGTEIFFRGESVKIESDLEGEIRFGPEILKVADSSQDLKPPIQRHLFRLAVKELPERVVELSGIHGIPISRISVRNQRSRWGSCSGRGTISLNWRLVQTPDFVSDYIILHELAHRKHMNHSDHFWQEVQRLCPDYLLAEKWLKTNRLLLR